MNVKKKIGIVTILNVNNYGAELQAFALQYRLNELGYDAEIINYLFYKNPNYKKTKLSRPFVKFSLKKRFKEIIYPFYKKIKSSSFSKEKEERDVKFNLFHEKYTKQTKIIDTIDELYKTKFDYDVYMVGSDQVWNPNTYTNLEAYFLTFAPNDKLKVAYASSFGVNSIPKQNYSKYKALLNNLDFIGVREKSGVEIINEVAKKDATWVLDPTFLLESNDWDKFSKPTIIEGDYILLYILTDADYITDIARKIAKEKSLKIVRICKNAFVEDPSDDVINIIDAGPEEYLGLFSKASFVLTTSFHGTCFSLNYSVPFYTVLKKEKSNNSRQIDLLNDVGLGDRILYVNDALPEESKYDISFDKANESLKNKREESLSYLKKAVSSEK